MGGFDGRTTKKKTTTTTTKPKTTAAKPKTATTLGMGGSRATDSAAAKKTQKAAVAAVTPKKTNTTPKKTVVTPTPQRSAAVPASSAIKGYTAPKTSTSMTAFKAASAQADKNSAKKASKSSAKKKSTPAVNPRTVAKGYSPTEFSKPKNLTGGTAKSELKAAGRTISSGAKAITGAISGAAKSAGRDIASGKSTAATKAIGADSRYSAERMKGAAGVMKNGVDKTTKAEINRGLKNAAEFTGAASVGRIGKGLYGYAKTGKKMEGGKTVSDLFNIVDFEGGAVTALGGMALAGAVKQAGKEVAGNAAEAGVKRVTNEYAAKVVAVTKMKKAELDKAIAEGKIMKSDSGEYVYKDGKYPQRPAARVIITDNKAPEQAAAAAKKKENADLKAQVAKELEESRSSRTFDKGTYKGTMDDLKRDAKTVYPVKTALEKAPGSAEARAAALKQFTEAEVDKATKAAGGSLSKAQRSEVNKAANATFQEANPLKSKTTKTGDYQLTLNDGTTHLVSETDYPELATFASSLRVSSSAAAPSAGTGGGSAGSAGGGTASKRIASKGYARAKDHARITIEEGKTATTLRNKLRKDVTSGKITQADMDRALAEFGNNKAGGSVKPSAVSTNKGGAALPDLYKYIADNNLSRKDADAFVAAVGPSLNLTDGHMHMITGELDKTLGKTKRVADEVVDGTKLPKDAELAIKKAETFYVNKKGMLTAVDKTGLETKIQLTPEQAALAKKMKADKTATKAEASVSAGKTDYEAKRVAAREAIEKTSGKKMTKKEKAAFNKTFDKEHGGDPSKVKSETALSTDKVISTKGDAAVTRKSLDKPAKAGKTTEVINGKKVTGAQKQVDKVNNIVNPKEVPQASKEIMHRGKNPQAEWDTTALIDAGKAAKVENASVGGVKKAGWRLRDADGNVIAVYKKSELGASTNMALSDQAGLKNIDRATVEKFSAKAGKNEAPISYKTVETKAVDTPAPTKAGAEKPANKGKSAITKEQRDALQPQADENRALARAVWEKANGRKLAKKSEERRAVNRQADEEFWKKVDAGEISPTSVSRAATVANGAGKAVDDVGAQVQKAMDAAAAPATKPTPSKPAAAPVDDLSGQMSMDLQGSKPAIAPTTAAPLNTPDGVVSPEAQALGDAMGEASSDSNVGFTGQSAKKPGSKLKTAAKVATGAAVLGAVGVPFVGGLMNQESTAEPASTEPSITELLNGTTNENPAATGGASGAVGYSGGSVPQISAPAQQPATAQEAFPEWIGDGTIPEDVQTPEELPIEEMPFEDILTDELQQAIEGNGGYSVDNIMAAYTPYIEDEQAAIDSGVDAEIEEMKSALSARGILNSDLEVALESAIRSKAETDKQAVYSKYLMKAQDTSMEYQYKYSQLNLQEDQLAETTRMNDFEMAKYDQDYNLQIKKLEQDYNFQYAKLTLADQKFLWDKYVDTQKLNISAAKANKSSSGSSGAKGKTMYDIAEDLQARLDTGATNSDIATRLKDYVSYGYISQAQANTLANNLDYNNQ